MKRYLSFGNLILSLLFLLSCGPGKEKQTIEAQVPSSNNSQTQENGILTQLANSPRHQEWITLQRPGRDLQAFVVYPESKSKTKSIIVIHENRGLDDWARLFSDKLAAAGYLVIAPDFISNTQGKERTSDFDNPDAAREAIYALDPAQVTADLDAAYKFLETEPSSTGEVAVIGFCWGGSQAFRYATNNNSLSSVHVFYGTAPDDGDALSRISAPVYGYYGGDDNRVNSTIDKTKEHMNTANNTYDYIIYEDAGHAFMKRGIAPDAIEANKKAMEKAWDRLLSLLNK